MHWLCYPETLFSFVSRRYCSPIPNPSQNIRRHEAGRWLGLAIFCRAEHGAAESLRLRHHRACSVSVPLHDFCPSLSVPLCSSSTSPLHLCSSSFILDEFDCAESARSSSMSSTAVAARPALRPAKVRFDFVTGSALVTVKRN
jgi:hypothetical protein